MDKLLVKIKAHAAANYNNGYDFVVECYSDEDIIRECTDKGWTTLKEWTGFYADIVEIRAERFEDARIEGGEW